MTKLLTVLAVVFFAPQVFAKEALKVVPNKDVCMVTNMYFGKMQIPVEVSGKTYYGCCENCKKTLSEDAEARTATDALTNQPVDKATAVIAAKDDNSVLYFANQENLKKYSKK